MLERLTGTLLVAAGEPVAEAESGLLRYCLMAGRRVLRRGEVEAGRLSGLGGYDLRASFFDRSAYFGRVASQTANARLAGVVARRFVDGELLFNEPYRLRLAIHPTGEHDFQLRLVAASELACVRLEDLLPLETRPVSTAALEETAIAALVARVTPAPALVLFARDQRFLAFVAEAGEVRQRSVEMLFQADDMAAAQDAANRAEAMLAGSGDSALGAPLKLYLGALRPLAGAGAAQRDFASRELEKKLAALVQGGDALAEPELFGLNFVARRWNLLEAEQVGRAWAWKAALPVTALMAGGSLLLAGLGLAVAYENGSVSRQIEAQQAAVAVSRAELVQRIPADQEVARIKELTELLQQREQQVRIDHLLSWLTRQIPPGASVAALHLFPPGETPPEVSRPRNENGAGQDLLSRLFARDPAPAPGAAPVPVARPVARPGEYELTLELILPGSYEHSEALAAQVIGQLAARAHFKQSLLTYDAPLNRALLRSQLSVQAEDFRQP